MAGWTFGTISTAILDRLETTGQYVETILIQKATDTSYMARITWEGADDFDSFFLEDEEE